MGSVVDGTMFLKASVQGLTKHGGLERRGAPLVCKHNACVTASERAHISWWLIARLHNQHED